MVVRKTSPARLAVALRRGEAIRRRILGHPIHQIAVDLGYRSVAALCQDISRALAEWVGEPAAELRAIELLRMDATLVRLDEREAKVLEVRDREHITVNNGHIIYVPGPGGELDVPLLDDAPVLQATAQLIAIERQRADVQKRRAELVGLNAPTKVSVITDEALDEAEAKLLAEIADLERAVASEDPEPEGTPET